MALDLPEELPEGYYLENFEYLLNFVQARYQQLLTNDEKAFASDFFDLSPDAKKLFVRLTNRKGIYFRVDKLNYEEISDQNKAIDELGRSGFVDNGPDIHLEDALGLITKDEMLQLSVCCNVNKSVRRLELEELVLEEGSCDLVRELDLNVIEVGQQEALQIHRVLFFGNFHQDMTEFVLHELVMPFESYPLSEDFSLFSERQTLEEAIQLHELGEISHDLVAEDEDGSLIVEFLSDFPQRADEPMLARRYDRIVNRLGRQLERLGVAEEALSTYTLSKASPSRERRARLLEKDAKVADALDLCREIVSSPNDEEELEFAIKFGHRISRRHNHPNDGLPSPGDYKIPEEKITVRQEQDTVELCALHYYLEKGYQGYYVENALFRTIFGLAFWDIIFAPVKGVFFNPFQRGPLDLYTPEFRQARADLIDERLKELSSPDRFREIVLSHARDKDGLASDFVSWGLVEEAEFLKLALDRIPAEDYIAVFNRLLLDLKNNTNGLPDLILFDEESYRLVEVKGPGDRLQKNQTRWFHYFLEKEIPAIVLNVEYQD